MTRPRAAPPAGRRGFLVSASALAVTGWSAAAPTLAEAHDFVGVVNPPKPLPAIRATMIGARPGVGTAWLGDVLKGKVTALQLMFTGCSSTCPIQGALFAELQGVLQAAPPGWQMLSVSIDPLGDDPKSMRAWLARFGANASRWNAAVPTLVDVDATIDFLRGRSQGADRHTPQVYLFDSTGRLRYRTADMPAPTLVASIMARIAEE